MEGGHCPVLMKSRRCPGFVFIPNGWRLFSPLRGLGIACNDGDIDFG